jgi:hypothetical protein
VPGALAAVEGGIGQLGPEEDQHFGRHAAILDEAERKGVDPGPPGDVGRMAAEPGDRIGEARAVHVEAEPAVPGELAQRGHLVRRVDQPYSVALVIDRPRADLVDVALTVASSARTVSGVSLAPSPSASSSLAPWV